jgi:hypothetical protein
MSQHQGQTAPLPKGFHRIRHYGLLASGVKADNLATMRKLLAVAEAPPGPETANEECDDGRMVLARPCPCCGGRMLVIEIFDAGCSPRHRPAPPPRMVRIDTS